MHKLLTLVFIALLPILSGCMAVAVGGAAATGVLIAEDRRTVGTITEDQGIELKAANRIEEKVKDAHINVTSYNRMVLLTGEVPTETARADAERIARAVENVRSVFNELQVAGNTAMQSRTNDAVITSKVKARFVDARKFSPVHVKVVTENSVVYLMGMVKKQEAADATEVARTTGGVTKVVRVFEYLD
ncbi:MAG: BON domain-containing protein [Burkholderiales bacterium]|jgi:osmotically-inducible protein OsmY|nr:BON domain-containing protein [Burkholderiales bacterium]